MASRNSFPPELVLSGDKAKNWRKFKIAWVNYENSAALRFKKTSKERVEILLACIAKDAMSVYENFKWEKSRDKYRMENVIRKFEVYYTGKGSPALSEPEQGEHDDVQKVLDSEQSFHQQRRNSEGEEDSEEASSENKDEDYKEPSLHQLVVEGRVEFEYLKRQLEFIGVSISTEKDLEKAIDTDPISMIIPKYYPKSIPKSLKLMSWNIDGLSDAGIGQRHCASSEIIESFAPDIILLQEVSRLTFNYIVSKMSDKYVIIRQQNKNFYFTVTLLKIDTVKYESHKIIMFRHSNQGRSILLTKATIGSAKLAIINVHLESSANKVFSAYRREQLQKCISIASSMPKDINVIIGGDLNIRNWEVKQLKVPKKIRDIWVELGSNPATEFTWDTRVNKNTPLGTVLNHKPKLRFDRILLRASSPETIKPKSFELTGKDKIQGLDFFPSDHWAIVTQFALLPNAQKHLPREENLTHSTKFCDDKEVRVEDGAEFVKDNWDDDD